MMRRGALLIGALAALVVPARFAPAQGWDELRAVYDYDAAVSLDASVASVEEAGQLFYERLSFAGDDGERVPALLMRPTGAERPPCALFLHGLGGDKDQAKLVAALLAPYGIAVLAIDARLHGDRAPDEGLDEAALAGDFFATGGPLVRTVIDNRRAIDYIATRDDVDTERIVVVGASMGAILGSVLSAVDKRVDAAALIVGGGDWATLLATSEHPLAVRLREAGGDGALLARIDPVNFVGHVSPRPVLMVNGTTDAIMPTACAEALHAAAGEPKEIIWYEGGHVGMPPQTLMAIGAWIVEQAGVALPAAEG